MLYERATREDRELSDRRAVEILKALGEARRGRVEEPSPMDGDMPVDEPSAEAAAGQRLGRRPPA